jgi:very-short-patch-repair endonuclease
MGIEQLRNKLVDLTLRNKLLTIRLDKGAVIRIVDEVPEQVFAGLLTGHSWSFDALPEPTRADLESIDPEAAKNSKWRPDEAAWATRKNISANYDLPATASDARHRDRRLQTLLYREKLEIVIRRLAADSRSAIDETGSNMLFLGLGLLEWLDPRREGDKAKPLFAPLLLVPVRLDRAPVAAGLRTFTLQWSGEDVQENLALRLLLERDFSIKLPEYDPELGVDDYFASVASAVESQVAWKIRRQLYVTLISQLGKLLLYNDLDPKNWHNGKGIEAHPIVGRLLGAEASVSSEVSFEDQEEVSAATLAAELELPVVDRIDSSQLEALRLALAGENLVIQGPPGTGKSQTITNLIAALLSSGKSVLFVAEKLAAIDVVKRRLDAMQLGDFCLELHSNRKRKKSFIETVGDRLDMGRKSSPSGLDERRRRLESQRDLLADHIRAVSREVSPERTAADVFFAAGRSSMPLGPVAGTLIDAAIPNAIEQNLPAEARAIHIHQECYDRLQAFAPILADMLDQGPIASHPWREANTESFLPDDVADLRADLLSLRDAAKLAVSRGAELLSAVQSSDGHLLESINALVSGVDVLLELRPTLQAADAKIEFVREAIKLPFPRGRAALIVIGNCATLAAAAPSSDLEHMNERLLAPHAVDALEKAIATHERIASQIGKVSTVLTRARWEEDGGLDESLSSAIQSFANGEILHRFSKDRKAAAELVRNLGGRRNAMPARSWAEVLTLFASTRAGLRAFESDKTLQSLVESPLAPLRTPWPALHNCARWAAHVLQKAASTKGLTDLGARLVRLPPNVIRELATFAGAPQFGAAREALIARDSKAWPRSESIWSEAVGALTPAIAGKVMSCRSAADLQHLRSSMSAYAQSFADADALRESLAAKVGGDETTFAKSRTASDLVAQVEVLISELPRLAPWSSYCRHRSAARDMLTAPVIDMFEHGDLDPSLLAPAWSFAYHRAFARRLFQTDPTLRKTTGAALSAARAEFRDLDQAVMTLRRQEIAATLSRRSIPAGIPGPKVANMTERALLERERSKQRAHRPIREVMRRSGRALKAIKPCFMMGPLAVAQYLTPGALDFDVVIMDEASQLRPEEALGAVARGHQLIVVGDDKQLPPTTFFERSDDGDFEDEEEIVGQREESVLRLAAQTFPGRMLLWHYRSRNESLIAFSNYHFYGNRLILFPTPNPSASGINFEFVERASFQNGVNEVEARAVAAAAFDHLRSHPAKSLIVVAMNIRQKELIRSHFYELSKDDPAFAQSDEKEGRDEPFDIKNLENVQGDERDVVMISMTYGPEPSSGRVARRFGPINGQHGHRRLNVLFSRARENMIVFSSMRHGDVLAGENASAGVVALKNFLLYAEHKVLSAGAAPVGSGRPPDSDFEIAVAEALQQRGFECVAQLGVAGFFLDIAVRDPRDPEKFVLGIECDGATYHSSRSARDRDRLRQEVLEGLGWKIERVWSTDWFLDPDAQIRRLLAALESVDLVRER